MIEVRCACYLVKGKNKLCTQVIRSDIYSGVVYVIRA